MNTPTARYLSLGAGIQSSTCLLLAVQGTIPSFDAASGHGSARVGTVGHPLRGQFFPHRQRVPLDQVRLRPQSADEADAPGCGPWTCPHADEQAPVAAIEADGAGLPVREVT